MDYHNYIYKYIKENTEDYWVAKLLKYSCLENPMDGGAW